MPKTVIINGKPYEGQEFRGDVVPDEPRTTLKLLFDMPSRDASDYPSTIGCHIANLKPAAYAGKGDLDLKTGAKVHGVYTYTNDGFEVLAWENTP